MATEGQAIRGVNHRSYGAVHQSHEVTNQERFDAIAPYHTTQAEVPSAPHPHLIDYKSEYEGTFLRNSGSDVPPPPELLNKHDDGPPPSQANWNIPAVSEDIAKDALIKYADSKLCYSRAPAVEMVFRDLKPFNTYRYSLETFTETRCTDVKTVPYNGEFVDSCMLGVPPLLWNIQVEVPSMFTDHVQRVKVPHTSLVKGCFDCAASGRVRCRKCHGRGQIECWVCHGSRTTDHDNRCSHCSGRGYERCISCSGQGLKKCDTCQGRGQMLSYTELQVKWKNNIFEYVVDQKCGFPAKRFKAVRGEKIFVDEQVMVYPVVNFPDPSINQASQNAVQQHHAQFASSARVLRQRQTIELIFLTQVEYEWKGTLYSYYVYGNENEVYAENYPKKCCCSIM
ncbi:hypothetical protein Y1Q_0023779 [Alligator mississippiensis]|uniref:Protein SSUH2 homolog n=2 Tax=Alligator mississippiensis TaxID=8496 RepID=A0A151MKJ2_ALLMI|nr:hypothetical protein Y1Q_0023779 [Alligator mississippiensis]